MNTILETFLADAEQSEQFLRQNPGQKKKKLVVLGTHGDEILVEPYWLEGIRRLIDQYRDRFDILVGNPRAVKQNRRFTEGSIDMNRIFPGTLDSPIYEERRAAQIIDFTKGYDEVLDCHTTGPVPCGAAILVANPTT